ncbi:hypothetical protein DICVIV_06149, partial [Dictyocaulus viviparus]
MAISFLSDTINESDLTEFTEKHDESSTQAESFTAMPFTTSEQHHTTTEVVEPIVVLGNRSRNGTASRFQRGCVVKFQARPFSERPPQFQAEFEVELPTDSVELCATRCYQDGCSGAKFDPIKKLCALSYNDKYFCTTSGVVLHYEATEITWIHCVNCCESNSFVFHIHSLEPRTNHSTTITSPTTNVETQTIPTDHSQEIESGFSTPTSLMNGTNLTDEEIQNLLKRGCVVHFQVVNLDERPPHFTSQFETSFIVDTAEICAYRCYQDGCTGAKFLPDTRECSLSYNDRPYCSNSQRVTVLRSKDPVFMHCLNCVAHKLDDGVDKQGNGFLANLDEFPTTEKNADAEPTDSSQPPIQGIASNSFLSHNRGVSEGSGENAMSAITKTNVDNESGSTQTEKTPKSVGIVIPSTKSAVSKETEEESDEFNQSSQLEASMDEEKAESFTLPGNDQEGTSTTSTTIHSQTSSIVESSGDEPVEGNRIPNVEASIDEMTAAPSEVPKELVDAKSSVGTDQATTITASVPTETEISSTLESSGEEIVEGNRVPNVQASIDETTAAPSEVPKELVDAKSSVGTDQATTITASVPTETEISSTLESSGEEIVEGNRVPNVQASIDETTAAPSEVPKELVDAKSSVGTDQATTITASVPTETEISSTLESSGEEIVEGNRVPNVQASIDETTAAPSEVPKEL